MSPRRDFLHHNVTLWNDFLSSLRNSAQGSGSKTAKHHLNGTSTAALGQTTAYLIIAILANHIRRVVSPWLGQFIRYHAIDDMKLSRSGPYYLIEDVLAGYEDHWAVGIWFAQVLLLDLAWRLVRRRIHVKAHREKRRKWEAVKEMVVMDVTRVAYLALGLAAIERCYIETCILSAQLYAYKSLFFSSSPTLKLHARSLMFMKSSPLALLLQWMFILYWGYATVLPNLLAVRKSPLWGSCVFLFVGVVAKATMFLVKYSNKYFVAIQMGDGIVTLGWIALAVGWAVVSLLRGWLFQ